jgi:hypothetical protein
MASHAWDRTEEERSREELEALAWVIECVVRPWSALVDSHWLDDLRQEARLGVWRAMTTYCPGRGSSLSTYAYHCARRRVADAMRAYRRNHEGALPLKDGCGEGDEPEPVNAEAPPAIMGARRASSSHGGATGSPGHISSTGPGGFATCSPMRIPVARARTGSLIFLLGTRRGRRRLPVPMADRAFPASASWWRPLAGEFTLRAPPASHSCSASFAAAARAGR